MHVHVHTEMKEKKTGKAVHHCPLLSVSNIQELAALAPGWVGRGEEGGGQDAAAGTGTHCTLSIIHCYSIPD